MTTEQAKNLIIQTFENQFDKNNFITFISNILKSYDKERALESRAGIQGVTETFLDFINSWERIGRYEDEDENIIDILIVKLKRETSLYRARTAQRNFVANYLMGKLGTNSQKDAALVAFVTPDQEDWRFSLVKMEYRFSETPAGRLKVKEEFTPAKRWSFLVGKNEKSHTAQSRFIEFLINDDYKPTLKDLEKAFDIEVVTKEFFEKYRDLFIRTKLEIDKILLNDKKVKDEFENKVISSVDFAKKLLGQIVFLYYLQKKGWFGVERGNAWGTGPKDFFRKLFNKEFGDYQNFYNDILEPLFYEALRTDRSADDHYYSKFNCKIPFLNGGLFDPLNDYDWVNTDIIIPNELFSNSNVNGILDIFDLYNFTVNEEEPLEKEVALDPELLGKIYEKLNAIRADNFDEYQSVLKSGRKGDETKFNKEYGVYYTPREIVHYMCQESLIYFLHSELNQKINLEDLEEFVRFADFFLEHEQTAIKKNEKIKNGEIKSTKYENKMPDSIIKNANEIDKLLSDLKVCDPAVGSGAFPIGMLHEIVKLKLLLSKYLKNEKSTYDLKRETIEKTLYGVDMDPGAVEICKLRFWLSLIVDEEEFYQIKPLPNLDYKIVCGDSLLRVEKDLFNQDAFNKLKQLKPEFFNETNTRKKQELRRQIDSLIFEITKGHKEFDFEVYFSEVFQTKKGFDIIIANPPYLQLQKAKNETQKYADLYKNQNFEVFDRTGDIYCLFYEKGLKLLKNGGFLAFITSNKWMRAGYGKTLREFFLKYNPLILIDLGPGVFESATVDTSIIILQNARNNNQLKAVTLQKEERSDISMALKQKGVTLTKLSADAWFIGSDAEQRLKEKIERIGKPLKDWDVKIYRGVLTGLNEAFIITTEKRNEILANCRDEAERRRTEAILKPILRGRDIKRYYYEWAGLWVIGTFPALKLNIDDYSALKKYFLDNFDIRQLEQSGKKYPELGFDARKKTGNKWFETQDQIAYYPEFEKEKVAYSEIVRQPQFFYDTEKFYVEATSFLMTGKNVKYICGLLNSKPIAFIFKNYYAGGGLGEEGYRYKKAFLENLPLPPITPTNEPIVKQIEALVDKILSEKKQDHEADTSQWEKEIDALVYRLYDLTDEEIKIIEEGKNKKDYSIIK